VICESTGLRHLPVTDRLNNLVGLITRKDLTNLEYRLPSDHDHADHEARHTETASLLGSVSSFGEHDSLISLANSQSLKDMLIAQGVRRFNPKRPTHASGSGYVQHVCAVHRGRHGSPGAGGAGATLGEHGPRVRPARLARRSPAEPAEPHRLGPSNGPR
jgi:hypothetical protein